MTCACGVSQRQFNVKLCMEDRKLLTDVITKLSKCRCILHPSRWRVQSLILVEIIVKITRNTILCSY